MDLKAVLFAVALTLSPVWSEADTYVLVHGAFQDATIWFLVAERLEAAGHDVVTVDLPGRDATGAAAEVSLDAYIGAVGAVVQAQETPVILVGHSFGGMTITGVADRHPDNIAKLIFVAAYVPVTGESMEDLALSDSDNAFTQETFVIADDYSHASILPEDQVRVFAQDANDAQAAALQASMVREPFAPIGTPLALTGAGGDVPMAYIRTLADRTVSTPLQTRMIERAAIATVADIDTGHAPYLTQPAVLADLILMVSD
ncbi:MAG: alpha/beta fold hydrolase [Pseudomonadota bacterium]